MQIKKTDDYEMFKFKKGNRPVTKGHVNLLVRSIKRRNMLEANPIIINFKNEIIDGQHRLEAAKILQTPIYYVVFEPASLSEIQALNANQKSWTAIDYMESYIYQGKKDYEVYKEYREKYHLPHGVSIALLSGRTAGGNTNKAFKEGNFTVNDLEEAVMTAEEITEMKPFLSYGTFGSTRFYQAIEYIINRTDMKLYYLVGKIKETGTMIFPSGTRLGYLRQFEDVLNKNRAGQKRIILG